MEGTFKTLIKPSTKEFVHIIGQGDKGTSAIPHILASTATEDALNQLYPNFDWTDCELWDIHVQAQP